MDPQSLLLLTDRAPSDAADADTPPTPEPVALGAVLTGDGEPLVDDLAFCADVGIRLVRLDVPWRSAQPRAGRIDESVFERLHEHASDARRLGLQPWFRLLQVEVPLWFDDDGGFTDTATAARWWPRWVEEVALRLGDVAAGWIPFEAPYAMARRLVPADPRRHGELMDSLVVAWRNAWRILRGGPPVATSLDVATERPTDESPESRAAAQRRDQLRWGLWLDGLAHGRVRIPGRADRDLPDLEGACDVLGLAVRSDVARHLHRAQDQGPDRPMAVTFRPEGATDAERATSIASMWHDVDDARRDLRVQSVTITPLLDRDGSPGIATERRQVKDSGAAFLRA